MTPLVAQLPPMSARLAVLAAAAHRLVGIVCHGAEAGPPAACQGAEDALHNAALVCPTGAEALLPDFTDVERVFLASVLAFPPVWSLPAVDRRAGVAPLRLPVSH